MNINFAQIQLNVSYLKHLRYIVQVYVTDVNGRHDLDIAQDRITLNTDAAEAVCMGLNGLILDDVRLVFESTKGRLLHAYIGEDDLEMVAIDDIDISAGHCPGLYWIGYYHCDYIILLNRHNISENRHFLHNVKPSSLCNLFQLFIDHIIGVLQLITKTRIGRLLT